MSQTDELHESFYDLFNQRFRRIDDPKTGPRFYANIAIGAHHKPCRVHPSFQCVVVVKRSEIDAIPHPFLNRFEKYSLTHKILLDAVLSYQPAYLRSVLLRAKDKVHVHVLYYLCNYYSLPCILSYLAYCVFSPTYMYMYSTCKQPHTPPLLYVDYFFVHRW